LDIPAFSSISSYELIKKLKNKNSQNATFILNHPVVDLKKADKKFIIDNGFSVKSVIIATGTGSFTPKKFPLKMDNEIEKKVHYYVKDPQKFKNQKIGVFGGGDSALDWALN